MNTCESTGLEWVTAQARLHERVVEIASGLGDLTLILADNCPGEVWAIDQWGESDAKQFYACLKGHIESRKVHVANMAPSDFAVQWLALGRPPFDMVFFHAGPSDPEIEAWKPITRGLLCGYRTSGGIWMVKV